MSKSHVQRAIAINSNSSHVHDANFLRQQSRWIRDTLDPLVARSGPEALSCDDLLELDEFLRRLTTPNLPLDAIKFSRIHHAVRDIAKKGTRWPDKLIDRCDELIRVWQEKHGSLAHLGIVLYGPGGRLHGIAKPEDLSMDRLLVKWLKTKSPGVKLNPARARKAGDLGFKPGDWWINAMFAFREGMLDSGDARGGIVADAQGAYAVLMTDDDEIWGPTFDTFTYRARYNDKGKYRLTAATEESKQPVRILRSHTLRSFWNPRAGIRYDGLYHVDGWNIHPDGRTGNPIYDITFKRLPTEVGENQILRRPYSDEVEDYREYKRLRQEARVRQQKDKMAAIPVIKV